MHGLVCDRCGHSLLVGEDVRYVVHIRVYAAYDPLEITEEDLERAGDPAVQRALLDACAERSAEDLEAEVYKAFRFDLCMRCQRGYLEAPLPPAPEGERRGPLPGPAPGPGEAPGEPS